MVRGRGSEVGRAVLEVRGMVEVVDSPDVLTPPERRNWSTPRTRLVRRRMEPLHCADAIGPPRDGGGPGRRRVRSASPCDWSVCGSRLLRLPTDLVRHRRRLLRDRTPEVRGLPMVVRVRTREVRRPPLVVLEATRQVRTRGRPVREPTYPLREPRQPLRTPTKPLRTPTKPVQRSTRLVRGRRSEVPCPTLGMQVTNRL